MTNKKHLHSKTFNDFENQDIKELFKSDSSGQRVYELIKPILDEALRIVNFYQNSSDEKVMCMGDSVAMALAIEFNKKYLIKSKA